MKTVKLNLKSIVILTLACLIIVNRTEAIAAVQDGLQICSKSVLPVLFPFFVLSDLWIRCGAASKTVCYFAPMMERMFHLPGSAASALLLGGIGGYPMGAKTTSQLFEKRELSKQSAEHLLMFCNNAGPSFIIGIVGYGIFQRASAGVLLYAIHLISAMIIGFIFRPQNIVIYIILYRKSPFFSIVF